MILNDIQTRRSVLAFSLKPIEPEKLTAIFDAAHLAPSSGNNQPWRFIYATRDNPEEFKLLFNCLAESNQRWVKNAYGLILTIAEMISTYKDKSYPNKYAWHDTGMATALLMIQAQALGLNTHPMGGFDAEKAKADLHIPEPFQPVAMVAIGYHGNVQDLPEDLMKRETSPRNRKSLEAFVFRGKFEK
ncbi:MAG TPA: nitroreductase family protein, partial [Bacteroidales bacterium]